MMSGDDSSLVMESRGSGDDPKTPDFPKKSKTSYVVFDFFGKSGVFGSSPEPLLSITSELSSPDIIIFQTVFTI